MKLGKIYKITNLINNKIYIGQTIRDLKVRFKQHCYRNGCAYLHNALLKYGKANFKIELIEEVPIENLDKEVCNKFKIGRNTLKEFANSFNYKFLTYAEKIKPRI